VISKNAAATSKLGKMPFELDFLQKTVRYSYLILSRMKLPLAFMVAHPYPTNLFPTRFSATPQPLRTLGRGLPL
jgi:hypothetical protein